MTKCGQCSKQAMMTIKLGDKDKRHVCGKHYQQYKNHDDINETTFVRASEIDM